VYIFAVIVHVLVCFLLVLIVLLQRGKGASMGAAFGGSSQTIFGSSGPGTFLGKITTVIALVFMVTSLYLAYFSVNKGGSVMESAPAATEQAVPQSQPAQPQPQDPAPQPPSTPAPTAK
jgi:preprotein translocase subunit SecG